MRIHVNEHWCPYLVAADFWESPEGPVCTQIVVAQKEDGPGVNSNGLRTVPMGRILGMLEHQNRPSDGVALERAKWRRYVRNRDATHGRWLLDGRLLATVARVYREALVTGAKPTTAVGEFFDLASYSRAAVWVKRARERGHLGPAPGRRLRGEAWSRRRSS